LKDLADYLGVSPEEAESLMESMLLEEKDFSKMMMAHRTKQETLELILDSGRFKSQIEVAHSGGTLDPVLRADVEKQLFGFPLDVDPKKRPTYGALVEDLEGTVLSADYGDTVVIFKDSLKRRTTWVDGDSFDCKSEVMRPSPLGKPSADSLPIGRMHRNIMEKEPFVDKSRKELLRDEIKTIGTKKHYDYTEVQIHGTVSTSDIAEVVFSREPSERLKEALMAQDIPWRVSDEIIRRDLTRRLFGEELS